MSNRDAPRWIVRRSNYPFEIPGQKLGVVKATDRTAAWLEAEKQGFSRPFTVEPEHRVNPALEQAVAKAVKSAARRTRAGRFGRARSHRTPLGHPDGESERHG